MLDIGLVLKSFQKPDEKVRSELFPIRSSQCPDFEWLVFGSPLYSFVVAFSRLAKTHVGQLQRDMFPKMCDVIYEWTLCAVIM